MAIVEKILSLQENNVLSKHEQVVQGVIESIEDGVLTIGDQLPSINNMVEEIGFARKTIFKAYDELKCRGLIESRKLKGYFVISCETNITKRMALLLYAFQSFQEEFYNTFRKEMGKRFQIDVFFHHNNLSIFETLLGNIKNKYGMYVIAPIQQSNVVPLLSEINPKKLLIVDRFLEVGPSFSYIAQEFEQPVYNSLTQLLPEIKGYSKTVLIFDAVADRSPACIQFAFERFVQENSLIGEVKKEYVPGSLEKDTLYYVPNDSTLWHVLSGCVEKGYEIGSDVGILSQDDNVAKGIVFGGITTISTDFNEMAKKAACHIKEGKQTQMIIPTKLIKRKSL